MQVETVIKSNEFPDVIVPESMLAVRAAVDHLRLTDKHPNPQLNRGPHDQHCFDAVRIMHSGINLALTAAM